MERTLGEDGPIMYSEVPVMDRTLVVDGRAIFYARESSKYKRIHVIAFRISVYRYNGMCGYI